MRSSFKKAIATVGIVGAISVGGASLANATTTSVLPTNAAISISAAPITSYTASSATVPDIHGLTMADAIAKFEAAGFDNVQAAPGVSIGNHIALASDYQPGTQLYDSKLIVIYAEGV